MEGLIGRKLGMTQVFDRDGRAVPVTAIEVGPCLVVQRKTRACDGYDSAQIGFGAVKAARLAKAQRGRFEDGAGTPPRTLREFALDDGEDVQPGQVLTASLFEGISHVDITGMSKGRGFQGVVHRHRMSGGPATHGSCTERRIGAIGQRELPGRVHKGHRMAGHMGHTRVTVQNLEVVELRGEENLMLVRGAVPGPTGALLVVRKALKKRAKAGKAT